MPSLGVVVGRLDGKVAIVTGAGGGIGRQHALLLAEEGAWVLVNDIGLRAGADAAKVASEITGLGGTAVANATSATWDGAASIVAAALDSFGRIDILINNATAGRNNDLWRFTEDDWDLTFAVNLKGYFAMIRSAAPYLPAGLGCHRQHQLGLRIRASFACCLCVGQRGGRGSDPNGRPGARTVRCSVQRHPPSGRRTIHQGLHGQDGPVDHAHGADHG